MQQPAPAANTLTAAFDYGDFVCQFETGIDNIARFDGHLEVFAENQVIRVQYDTPYVRNLSIRLTVTGPMAGAASSSA